MHKNTKLTVCNRKAIYSQWKTGEKVSVLAQTFHVTRPVIYKILDRGKYGDFSVHGSGNIRFRTLKYGLKKINKTELRAKQMLEKRARRYEKKYPGEMMHFDTKSLNRARMHRHGQKSECLYIGIDDRSRHLFAKIMKGKNQYYSADFLEEIIKEAPYKIETAFSDNGTEFKGNEHHEFRYVCDVNGIEQKFTRVRRPQTNGKAERVIRTIMESCNLNDPHKTSDERKKILSDFILEYNTSRPHYALKEGNKLLTPCQILQKYSL